MEGGNLKAEGPRRALQRGINAAGKGNSGWQHLLCGQDSKQAAAEVTGGPNSQILIGLFGF